ncbi:MAG: hypothetical protein IIX64_05845 [Bacteroidales bacterium]|nr:hypothetical protein [Bacteroidales bacterium]
MKTKLFALCVSVFLAQNFLLAATNIENNDEMSVYNRKNDISVNYGFSLQDFVGGIASIATQIAGSVSGEVVDTKALGTIGLEYNRSLGRTISLGAVVNYSRVSNYLTTSYMSMDFVAAMATMKAYWFKKPACAMYSRVGLGAMMIGTYSDPKDGTNPTYTPQFLPAAQLSVVGIEFGTWVRGFVELGAGMQGILLTGVKFSF